MTKQGYSLIAGFALLVISLSTCAAVVQNQEKVLHSFVGGVDGASPYFTGLILDKAGNLYGTTMQGGSGTGCGGGCGTVFELKPSPNGKWTQSVIYSFTGFEDGGFPQGSLVFDKTGNLYGTTSVGGANNGGTVFELAWSSASGWQESVLFSFNFGSAPSNGVIFDKLGDLYGTTSLGGATGCFEGCGTVFELSPISSGGWTETTLYAFKGGSDGAYPYYSGVVSDSAGNLYGTTYEGGGASCFSGAGCGTVFKLEPSSGGGWTETLLYAFTGGSDGSGPSSGLTMDGLGNLYGTTGGGGAYTYWGTVFELTPTSGSNWTETVLHSFSYNDGVSPSGGVVFDKSGKLYGTTQAGGTNNHGMIFDLTSSTNLWTGTVLYSFAGPPADGQQPTSGVIVDNAGNLYGMTSYGGSVGLGVLFEIPRPWQVLKNSPKFNASNPLLLTDGTVMIQDYCASDWWQLKPDKNGSYLSGTWRRLADSVGYGPLFYASAVMSDGRVIIEGGEYDNTTNGTACPTTPVDTNRGALFDPTAGTAGIGAWTPVQPPVGWSKIGDASSVVLNDGTFMLGACCSSDDALLSISGTTFTWTPTGSGKVDLNSEEGWTLLPKGNVLTVDTQNGTGSELYEPNVGNWSSAGSTISPLPNTCQAGYVPEIGPAVLRPDGTVFATGGTNQTAIFNSFTSTWSSGPSSFPIGLGVNDGPAVLLPDGNVLVSASSISPCYTAPSTFFEFDGKNLTAVPGPPRAAMDPSFVGRMLLLPTGQVLFTDGSHDVEVYTPSGTYRKAWRPTILAGSYPTSVTVGAKNYSISGTQFNGLSQGAAYGDDVQAATNYPLVRITNNASHHVFYARTHNHSTMGVGTGNAVVSTEFDVLPGTETGVSSLLVVANGISSLPVTITVE